MTAEILHTVNVDLGTRSYPILIGNGLLRSAGTLLPFAPAGRSFFVLSDEAVAPSYGATICDSLWAAGARSVHRLDITAGEAAKSWDRLQDVVSWMLENGADRKAVLFAVGGGVIGDLGGFAASVMMRGITFVQVPTTLLAQVDSSVGGKTGINTKQGKNLVGAFHQPAAVLCDMETLKTLPRRELLAGYAEVAKYGLINDPEFFVWLESSGAKICALEPQALAKAVAISCRKKAEIVESDETEQGARALLNLGHTFGHAFEAMAGYDGTLLHGEAVSIGMVLAFRLSARLGLCAEDDADRVETHLAAIGLPVHPPAADVETLMGYMKKDKKTVGGKLVFILTRGIGKAFVESNVAADDVRAILIHAMKGK